MDEQLFEKQVKLVVNDYTDEIRSYAENKNFEGFNELIRRIKNNIKNKYLKRKYTEDEEVLVEELIYEIFNMKLKEQSGDQYER